jgi:hypothetical protein
MYFMKKKKKRRKRKEQIMDALALVAFVLQVVECSIQIWEVQKKKRSAI